MKISGSPFRPLNLWQFLLANVVLSLIILVVFFNGVYNSPLSFLLGFLWSFSICITQWAGPALIIYALDKRLSWMDKPVTRTFTQFILMLLWSVTAFAAVQLLMMYLINGLPPSAAWQYATQSMIYAFLIALFISLVFTSIGFFMAWRQSVLSEAAIKAEMMSYKYESLRNQINPHFLFNSFNVLSDLVYEDQEQAVLFIRQMSDLFRYVLDSRDKELVSLSEELEFMKSYAFLLKTRFGDKLNLKIDLKPDINTYIVPMTLQLLVENAVKHNEVSDKFPLSISIGQNNEYIEVENAVKPRPAGDDSKKTGLKNIAQQFAFFTDKEIEIKETVAHFLVRVPIIMMESSLQIEPTQRR
ncbi:MAG: histidine kinase [Lentimicrobium sp.]|jgi:sensor histidine kinase YesM|nr:histidine kinase [Lentimicrobium sp.]